MLIGQPITIIGAGIGGLAAALALAPFGARVEILEQADEISEVGAGLQISPNGVAVLDGLGLGAELRECAVEAKSVQLRDYRAGASVLQLNLQKYAGDQDFLFVHRADLINLLETAARARGVKISLGCEVLSIDTEGKSTRLTLADGSQRSVKLLIGADGLHSRLRAKLNGNAEPFFTGQVAWRAIVPAPPGVKRRVDVFMGPGRHLVRYPLRGKSQLNIVAVEERSDWVSESWSNTGDPDRLRRSFTAFCPEVQASLAGVKDVKLWGLFRHPVAEHWQDGSNVLLGDAAHPTLPFLAQGANLALEDAWVLADCLSRLGQEDALLAYQKRRKSRARRVIEVANSNARNYHLRNPIVRGTAHALLRSAGRLAPGKVVSQFDWIYRHNVTQD
mgnify:CR=1 FL=1